VKLFIYPLVSFLFSLSLNAQDNPIKIYVFDYTVANNVGLLTKPQYVSSFNTSGYVNQPHFITTDQLLVTSDHADKQFTDVYSLNLSSKTIERITDTKGISEYSPTLSKDGKSIFCVRTELDGETQNMWQYPSDKSAYGRQLVKKLNTIGYFQFLDDKQIVAFVVGSPNQLGIYDVEGNLLKAIDINPGRSFQVDFAGNIYYSSQEANGQFILKKYNKLLGTKESLLSLPSQYFNMLPDGNILSSKESKIYIYNYQNKSMDLWADLTKYNVGNITRIANKGNKLAIVTD
jgi:hypothetical protein